MSCLGFIKGTALFSGLLLLMSCAGPEPDPLVLKERSAATVNDSALYRAFMMRCSGLEITPADEAAKDKSLSAFILHLRQVVAEKNTPALLELLDDEIVSSHGGGITGKKGFEAYWDLQKDPASSALWNKLDRAISLGGCFDELERRPVFIMPYLQAGHYFENGCDFDWYNTYICLLPETKLYEQPDHQSAVIAKLKYKVLAKEADAADVNAFVPLSTIDHNIKGYVDVNDVYLCADHMLVLEKEQDSWIIKSFSPFD